MVIFCRNGWEKMRRKKISINKSLIDHGRTAIIIIIVHGRMHIEHMWFACGWDSVEWPKIILYINRCALMFFYIEFMGIYLQRTCGIFWRMLLWYCFRSAEADLFHDNSKKKTRVKWITKMQSLDAFTQILEHFRLLSHESEICNLFCLVWNSNMVHGNTMDRWSVWLPRNPQRIQEIWQAMAILEKILKILFMEKIGKFRKQILELPVLKAISHIFSSITSI